MTDPEFADRTYVEPVTPEFVEKVIARRAPRRAAADARRADGAELRGGARRERACSTRYGVELIGAKLEVIKKGEDRKLFAEAMERIGLEVPRSGYAYSVRGRRGARASSSASRSSSGPSFTMGGAGGGIAYNIDELREIVSRRRRALAGRRGARRGERDRLERVRDGGHARPQRQRGDRVLHRELRRRWACTPATRSPSRPRRRSPTASTR